MTMISTEEAAKRLARVILSDIELYSRERPRAGESLDAQIEEGRRLFGTRVTPAVLPLFDVVLADRRSASEKTPVATAMFLPVGRPSPAERPLEDQPTPGPRVIAQILDTHGARPLEEMPTPGPRVIAPILAEQSAPTAARNSPARRTTAPVPALPAHRSPVARGPEISPPALPALVAPPATIISPVPPAVPSAARSAAPFAGSAPEAPVPVLTSRISVPKLLALVAMAAAAVALLSRFLS